MKRKLYAALFLPLLLVAFCVTTMFAQDPETPAQTGNWLSENWKTLAGFVYAIYELVVRWFPTVNSWSILTLVMRVINAIAPDRTKIQPGLRSVGPVQKTHASSWSFED